MIRTRACCLLAACSVVFPAMARAVPQIGPELPLAEPRRIPAPASKLEAAAGREGRLVAGYDGKGVVVRTIDADGGLGPRRLLAEGSIAPQVAFNGTHYFVAWWTVDGGTVWLLRLNSSGVPVDPAPIKVATGTYAPYGYGLDLACNPTMCVLVVDRSATKTRDDAPDLSDVTAVRLSPAGGALDTVPIVIATDVDGSNAVVGTDGTDFLVSWVECCASNGGLKARRILADGSLPEAKPAQLAPNERIAVYSLTQPIIAFDGEGYDILWDGVPADNPSARVLFFQRVSRTGVLTDLVPRELARGHSTDFIAQRNSMAVLPDGVLVLWLARDMSTWSSHRMYALSLGRDGTPLGSAVDLGPESCDSMGVSLALLADPRGALALWTGYAAADDTAEILKMMFLDAGGTPVGGATPTIASEDVGTQAHPVGVPIGDGWFVAWLESPATGPMVWMVGVRVSSAGNLVDSASRLIASAPNLTEPALGPLGDGLLAVWREGAHLMVRRLSRDGTPLDASPFLAADIPSSAGATQMVPLGREALAVIQRSDTMDWVAVRIREDGSAVPYDLTPEDPRFAPGAAGMASFCAANVAGTPTLAQVRRDTIRSTIDLWRLGPESNLPASTSLTPARQVVELALAGGSGGGLVGWVDGDAAAPGFVRLSGEGAALDANPSYPAWPAGAPAKAVAVGTVMVEREATAGGGWLAGWRLSSWERPSAAGPLAFAGVQTDGTVGDVTRVDLEVPSGGATFSLAAGTGARILSMYQRSQASVSGTQRAFCRVVNWDDTTRGSLIDAGTSEDGASAADGGAGPDASRGVDADAAPGGTDGATTIVRNRRGCSCALAGGIQRMKTLDWLVAMAAMAALLSRSRHKRSIGSRIQPAPFGPPARSVRYQGES